MNLWLRLLWLLASTPFRSGIELPSGASVLHFRVWFHDLDAVGHMNNGRYLTIMDLGRADLIAGSGLWRAIARYRWTPIANAILIRFRREMRLFQKIRLESRLVFWDENRVVIEQTFFFEGGAHDGHIAARALFKGGLYERSARTFVAISRLIKEVGVEAASPALTDEIGAFLNSDDQMRLAGRS